MKLTAPQRGVLASFAFLLISMLSAQAFAFDVGGLRYGVINTTDVEVTGRARGNTATSIVILIPSTASDGTTTYSVTSIGNGAFLYNTLTGVIIPDSVTTIGKNAFEGNLLTSVTIPDSVTTIGKNAFTGNNLTSVTIGNSVASIGEFVFSSNDLTSVIIPASVTTIGTAAFINNALTGVTIVNSVTAIGSLAFQNNALTSVVIPDSVKSIGQNVFNNNALTSAHFGGNFGDFQLNMFDVNPNLTTITYCEGTAGWPQDFSNGSTTITATSIVCSPPDAPTIDSITPGAGQLTVAFTPGIDNGSPASRYTASCLRVVGSGRIRVDVVGPTSPITVPSMYNGDTYECFVTATNIIGTSPASATSEPFVVGAPVTFVPPPSGTPPPSTGTPPSSATPVPTSPLWLLGIMAGLLSLVGFRKLRKA
jgi:hypothetical protein